MSTDRALQWYFANGATASKITLGIPMYGRAFENTAGIGAPFSGVSTPVTCSYPSGADRARLQIGPGTIEAGIYSYKFLPLAGATVYDNLTDIASYSYDAAKRELVSYDTPRVATLKAQYAQNKNLAGAMFWEVSSSARLPVASIDADEAIRMVALDRQAGH